VATREDRLRAGLHALGLELSDEQNGQLLRFADLLLKWNRVYNLTALKDPDEVLTHHILDCAAVVPPLRRAVERGNVRLLDVGAGGGLPGVVIAIACPGIAVDCVDAVAKKAAFIQHAATTLGLAHLRGLHGRVEEVADKYDVVSSRAFASLADFVRLSDGPLAPGGIWMAMKGKYPADEIAALPAEVELFHVEQLQVPGLAAERCLLWLRRRAA
jgi:16S rRNA (guanine527-N7)-methyltransferase